eukprot:Skav226568  [mRNA]  locus=scaffold1701:94981:97480:+ [translate_table: standard]
MMSNSRVRMQGEIPPPHALQRLLFAVLFLAGGCPEGVDSRGIFATAMRAHEAQPFSVALRHALRHMLRQRHPDAPVPGPQAARQRQQLLKPRSDGLVLVQIIASSCRVARLHAIEEGFD